MEYQVSGLSMIMMSVALAAGVVIPVVLFLVMRFRFQCKAVPFWVGCGTFLLSACVLESILHVLVLQVSPVGEAIQRSIWLYALYGALTAGTFEETGRFLAMRFVLKKYHGDARNALMYGAGHGGFEALYVLGVGMISNLVLAFTINSGLLAMQMETLSGEAYTQAIAQVESLCAAAPWMFGVGILERFIAVTGHICFSVIVWIAAVRGGSYTWYYPLGILLHFLFDFAAVTVNHYAGALATEAVLLVLAVLFAVFARYLYRRFCEKGNEKETEKMRRGI